MTEIATAAGASRAAPRRIEGWRYPDGIRLAVNFTIDYDAQLNRRAQGEPPMELTQGEFGGRVGIWRLLELFAHHRVPITIFTPGRICELYPESLKAAARHGFEIANHMWEHRVPAEPDLERDHLEKTTVALEAIAGRRPVGTRSKHRLASLRRLGYVYTSNGAADDIPYWVADPEGGPPILNLPFHYSLDDAMYFHFGWYRSENPGQRLFDPTRVHDIWLASFHRLHTLGRYMNVCLHDFVSGRALRVAMLDRLLGEMKKAPGVWFATCEEIARYCLARFPDGAGAADERPAAGRS